MLSFLSAGDPEMVYTQSASRWSADTAPEECFLSVRADQHRRSQSRVLAEAIPLSVESVPLAQVLGMVLAEEIVAPHTSLPSTIPRMDGFAVRAADTADATAGSGRSVWR